MLFAGGRFSRRHGYRSAASEIIVREDAPRELRAAVIYIGHEEGIDYEELRQIVCKVLRETANPNKPNVRDQVLGLIEGCAWFRVYDVAEAIYEFIYEQVHEEGVDSYYLDETHYEESLNEVFFERGIGWQMVDGQIVVRGEESFESTVSEAEEALRSEGRSTAAREIHEALMDLSRRPEADVTGAIQHGMAALECLARDICGDTATLGALLKRLAIPKPLDQAVEKLWGFASEQGRHIREGRVPDFHEAALVVEVSASVCTYLSRRNPRGS